jgi:transposase
MISASSVISVGIDVGKAKLDVACLREDKSVEHQVFSNNEKGVKGAIQFLRKQRTACTVPCVLESTGDCHLLAGLMLVEAGIAVKCINPIITKKYTKSSIRDAKSDLIDCAMLARIGIIEAHLPAFSDTREMIRAKKLLSSISQLETLRQQLSAHFKQLKETADLLGFRSDAREAMKALEYIDKQIDTYRAQVVAAAPAEARVVADMTPGVSQQQVAVLLVGLGDKTFSNRDQLVAFVGLDVKTRQSGKWLGRQCISKRGNGYLRKVLFQVGWGLMMHHPIYNEYYKAMRARGKNHKTCIIATARKFLRFLFSFYWKRSVAFTQPLAPISIRVGAFRPTAGRALAMAAR